MTIKRLVKVISYENSIIGSRKLYSSDLIGTVLLIANLFNFVYTYLLSNEWGSELSMKLFLPGILYSLLFLREISLLDALISSGLGG